MSAAGTIDTRDLRIVAGTVCSDDWDSPPVDWFQRYADKGESNCMDCGKLPV